MPRGNIRDLVKDHICRFTVAVEGPDRVGKATQVAKLASRLQRECFDHVGTIEVPIKDEVTHPRIYEMLRDGRAHKYPSTFQGLQILNRVLYQEGALRHWMSQYDAFVFDRWNASSYAYGRAAGLTSDELTCELDLVADVDLVIILDGDPYKKDNLDTYEADMDFQHAVRDAYVEWGHMQPTSGHVYVVDANDTVDAVHEAIWDICSEFLEGMDISVRGNVIDLMQYLEKRRSENG